MPEQHIAEHEVVVVGARCAGAATAMLLAAQGHDVVALDRASFPSDTLSTHALSRGGVVQLARWGLLDEVLATGAPPIRQVSFHQGGEVITRTVKDVAGVDHLLAPRRHVLDTLLVGAARRAGATVRTGVDVTGLRTDPVTGRVRGLVATDADGTPVEVRAKVVVGADGLHSRVARWVGAPVVEQRPSEAAAWYTYVEGLDAEGFEFHVGDRAFAGVFSTNDGQANVWICLPRGRMLPASARYRTTELLRLLERSAPDLARRVRRARIVAPVRGTGRYPNHVRAGAGAGWALVGDAGYHRDPITGHGMTDAFRDAELLARHLGRALRDEVPEPIALAAYDAERRAALAPIFDVTCQLAQYPPLDEFSRLQKELSTLIEAEARWLAELPALPTGGQLAAA